jgi:hypothetical protein
VGCQEQPRQLMKSRDKRLKERGRVASRFFVPVGVLGSAVDYACSVDSMPPAGPNRILDNYDHLGRPVK